jgi:aminoglycoside phosphotransferase (APT) family kinase protein
LELDELSRRLQSFCGAKYETDSLIVEDIFKMPGHAGFSYGFSVRAGDISDKWYLRLPPPDVKLQGTADVLRQVAVLEVLPQSVPHCSVKWSGDEQQWFGRPYFIVPQLEGDVLRAESEEWVANLGDGARHSMAEQAMSALAKIHKVDWRRAAYLGDPIPFDEDVLRWDRFVEKAAEPQRLNLVPKVRELLLKQIPADAPIGIFHGDFQWSNLFYSNDAKLLAVIDWELVGVGATLNDVGWIATFNDPAAWAEYRKDSFLMPSAEELIAMYADAYQDPLHDLNWYRALAAYKFAIITGFNLMLHRRGKRHDPMWETSIESVEPLLARALALLTE